MFARRVLTRRLSTKSGSDEGQDAADEAEDQAVADGQEARAGEHESEEDGADDAGALDREEGGRREAVAEARRDQPAADLVRVLRQRQRQWRGPPASAPPARAAGS